MNQQKRTGIQGWEEFLTIKLEMLDKFDASKRKTQHAPIHTEHGNTAEFLIRNWLRSFLPKKYGVTSGRIVSQGLGDNYKLPHYDVIIYDALESPVLWIEEDSSSSSEDKVRAIPAEHVHGVIEVKARLTSSTAQDAMSKLKELNLILGEDPLEERYKKFLPLTFFSSCIFFELMRKDEFNRMILTNLLPVGTQRGYFGALILRGEGIDKNLSGMVANLVSGDGSEIIGTDENTKVSLIEKTVLAKPVMIEGRQFTNMIDWNVPAFAMYAHSLIQLMNGTYRSGFVPSMHGMSFATPDILTSNFIIKPDD